MNMLLLLCLLIAISYAVAFQASSHSRILRTATHRHLFGNPSDPKNTPAKKDAGGMFGGMGNIMESMKKAQEIAKQAEVMQKELAETMVTGADPSGQVQATFNGVGAPISVKVSDSILAQGAEAVSIAASQAVVDAHMKSQQAMVQKMQALYSGQK